MVESLHQPNQQIKKHQSNQVAPELDGAMLEYDQSEKHVNGDMSPQQVLYLQRTIGNRATQNLIQEKMLQRSVKTPIIQTDRHDRGCGCADCARISLKRDTIQRTDEHEEDIQAKRIVQRTDEHEEDIQAMRLIQRDKKEKPKPLDQQVNEATLDSVEKIKTFLEANTNKIMGNKKAMTAIAAKITARDFLTALGQIGGVPLKKQLTATYTYWTGITLADVQPAIDASSQSARDDVSKSKSLMKQAKTNMGTDEYLNMLPILRVFKKGKTAEDRKSHTAADKADQYIRQHLATHVGEAVTAGKQVEGQVSVVDGKDWKDAYEREFGDDGLEDTTNAFVDARGLIWVHKTRGNAGTVIHEGVHKYSVAAFNIEAGFQFNEGVTEFFTRKVTAQLKYKRGNYQSNFEFVEKFAAYVGEDKVSKAYFEGTWEPVKTEFETKSGESWEALKTHTAQQEWSDAEDMLK